MYKKEREEVGLETDCSSCLPIITTDTTPAQSQYKCVYVHGGFWLKIECGCAIMHECSKEEKKKAVGRRKE
jgi:hypothetical protein